ncbi:MULTISPECIES: hydrogenase subunit [unclassified Methanoregula]|uniref:hydrogenase subunit n=1 Tax=unclassified Methanoregula TaxID=2649730 RepID=UPI0009CFF874|nr:MULTISPECIES: hydrogenase subunit [unclassified Methanoregula]OPX62954.1 MAG: hydrogenase 4 membrane subunit [Methanoregula sp. PtaB.Bin085]OPY35167.1 MAG: hydrogenase 4 membrane subunit [Methanoregula sp. PtaU1.Bin006]
MIDTALVQGIIRILLVCIIITAAYIISTRNLLSLVSMYSLQSVTLVCLALALWVLESSPVLLAIAAVSLVSKAIVIPYFIATIQEKIRIRRDIEFHFLSPTTSLLFSMALMLVVYTVLSHILRDIPARDNLFFFGAVIGISLMLMGMMVMLSRKRAITKVLGFLSMENGVLLFGMFVTELPFIIEFLIIIDLIILVLLTTILTVGIDSTLEDYHKRLHRFRLVGGTEERP